MSTPALPSRFDPKTIEARWQADWAAHGYFRAPDRPNRPYFTVPIPPPNVTGILTMGHMLGYSVMDILVRQHRMKGNATLWVPGLDHAGLATQVEVRRRLAKEGVRLEDLPRAQILEQIELWRQEHEPRILEQTRAGGFSVDWTRYRYTMDPPAARATREVFAQLYRAGLIYRGERMVNWDPRLRTAVSDLEVTHAEEDGLLYFVRYPWADGSPGGLEVATVRPETIFGDVAVAVHPDDARHASDVGREVLLPIGNRRVPVVTDTAIDPAFGAGALKVTPRHDLVDYEIYRRHPDLPLPASILDVSGRLEGDLVPPELRGLDCERGREATVKRLEEAHLLLRTEKYRHSVARSERSDAVIEPRLSTQWFVKMRPLADPAAAAVRDGVVRIHPDRWTLSFFRWMETIQDWCISRQVVWGHPIPVSRCAACQEEIVYVDAPESCPKCGCGELIPDPDVLDTWFTSWLWPFLSLGWPEETADLAHYYPTHLLVTGRDIMFFWVARMMMAGLYFTGRAPFSDVYLTGMLRDDRGRRMSKHLGNSPDPLSVITERGADATRFALVFPTPTDEDGPFGRGPLEGARNFLTKVWNLTRFAQSHTPSGTVPPTSPPPIYARSPLEDRWVLSRYAATVSAVDAALARFEITQAATSLYQFLWHDLADRYVELIKDRLAGQGDAVSQRAARATLLFVIERSLRLLHPFVPHMTEELWHALPHEGESVAVAPWPSAAEVPRDALAEARMEILLDSIRLLRNLRAEEHVAIETIPAAWIRPQNEEVRTLLMAERAAIEKLARVHPLELLDPSEATPEGAATRVSAAGEYFILRPAASAEDTETLRRERDKLAALLRKTRARLADPGFRERAPPAVIQEAEEKARELDERLKRIDANLKSAEPSEGSGP